MATYIAPLSRMAQPQGPGSCRAPKRAKSTTTEIIDTDGLPRNGLLSKSSEDTARLTEMKSSSWICRQPCKAPFAKMNMEGLPVYQDLASSHQNNRYKLQAMTRLIQRFMLFSAAGFILSVAVHILGLLSKAPFFFWFAIPLHFGIFVGLLGVLVAFFRLRKSEGKGFWKRALRASPVWMRSVLLLSLIYALANFYIFWNKLFNLSGKSSDEITAIVLRGFSGHWMFFYFGIFLVFYSAMAATQQHANE